MRLGPVRAGEGAAGDERSGCQPRRPGPAALAVAREFRPAPAGGGLAVGRRRMRPASGPTRARRRGRDPGGPAAPGARSSRVLPGLEPHRGGLPTAGAGDSGAGHAVAGQAAGCQQAAQQTADDVRELPRNASPGPAWRRCHLPGARPGRRRRPRPGRRPANRQPGGQAALCPMSVSARLRARAARGCLRRRAASTRHTTAVRERARAQGTEVKDRGRNPPGRPPSSQRRSASKRAVQPRYQ